MKMLNSKNETAGETAIQIFNSESFGTIRTAGTADQPLFCLADVCKALNLSASDVKKRLDDDVVSIHTVNDRKGRKNKLNFVNEDGLYDVILDSRKAEAKAFRKWITSEVLPSIRKTGGYMAVSPGETPEQVMARALKLADETMKRQQATIESQNGHISRQDELIGELNAQVRRLVPLEGYLCNAIESGTTYTMTQVAEFLGFHNVASFLDWTVRIGILRRLDGRWIPMPGYLDKGYFSTRVYRRMSGATCIEENYYTVVTEAGRMMLYRKMEEWTTPQPDPQPQPRRLPRRSDGAQETVTFSSEEGGAI